MDAEEYFAMVEMVLNQMTELEAKTMVATLAAHDVCLFMHLLDTLRFSKAEAT
jgi:hypothetical protein